VPGVRPQAGASSWLDPYARVTRRLGESVARLCRVMTILHVARFYGLDWKTVKELDRASLERELGPVELTGIEVIGLDEFAIQKGHRYATVMDMNSSFELEVKTHCPNAVIVFDLFHVIAKYGREVIDRVRVDRANELRDQHHDRRIVKGARWLLLKNRSSLRPGEEVELDELLAANHSLLVVYVLRDALKELWHYRHSGYAARAWQSWYRQALRSRIEPLVRFARRLQPYLPGILAHCRWPLGTNLIEGINNRIKVIKRMAYGFRDDPYFFLKIRAAFPGVGR
jgi:transposase